MPQQLNLIGQILDEKYRIDRELGQGGMGAVFKAVHLGTERPVAVKVIMPEFMTDDQFVEAAESVVLELFKIVVEDFGFEAPGDIEGLGFDDQINVYYSVFTLIFGSCFHSFYSIPN